MPMLISYVFCFSVCMTTIILSEERSISRGVSSRSTAQWGPLEMLRKRELPQSASLSRKCSIMAIYIVANGGI